MAIGNIVVRNFFDARLEGLAKDDLLRRALTGDPEALRKNAQSEGMAAQFEVDFTTTDATAGEVMTNIGFSATPVAGLVDFSRPVVFPIRIEDYYNNTSGTLRGYAAWYGTVLGNATTPVSFNATTASDQTGVAAGNVLGLLGTSVSAGVVRAVVTGIAATNITHRVRITVYDPVSN